MHGTGNSWVSCSALGGVGFGTDRSLLVHSTGDGIVADVYVTLLCTFHLFTGRLFAWNIRNRHGTRRSRGDLSTGWCHRYGKSSSVYEIHIACISRVDYQMHTTTKSFALCVLFVSRFEIIVIHCFEIVCSLIKRHYLVCLTGATIVAYILPGISYYVLHKDNGPSFTLYGAIALFCAGMLIMPVCVVFIFV